MDAVTLSAVTKRFAGKIAVDRVDLDVAAGEFMALLGPSGCGKTTLLRLLAGFEAPDAGTIKIGSRIVAQAGQATVPPEARGVGMVFQSYALWPHMNVRENVEYALKVRGMARDARNHRVERALTVVGLPDRAAAMPETLSGGQRQRVALARCIAMEPSVILMDEPLANLDVHLRDSLQAEFHRLHRELGATILYITHDQAEAMALADRVAVMHDGRIQQIAAPRRLYAEPATPMSPISSAAAWSCRWTKRSPRAAVCSKRSSGATRSGCAQPKVPPRCRPASGPRGWPSPRKASSPESNARCSRAPRPCCIAG